MSSSIAAKSRALTARTVHLKLFPAPRNFNEQREVLRVLERFGEVTMFRFLKHRVISPVPNAFIATFANEASVTDIIKAGPIRYRLIPDVPPPSLDVEAEIDSDLAAGKVDETSLSTSDAENQRRISEKQAEEEEEKSTFELHPSPSIFSHAKYLTSPHTNPLYGPFEPYPVHKSLVGSMLYKSVGSSMWAPGLRDWETDVERWRIAMNGASAMEEVNGKDGEVDSEKAVYTRAAKRRREKIPEIMWGVRRFKTGCERAEGGGEG